MLQGVGARSGPQSPNPGPQRDCRAIVPPNTVVRADAVADGALPALRHAARRRSPTR